MIEVMDLSWDSPTVLAAFRNPRKVAGLKPEVLPDP